MLTAPVAEAAPARRAALLGGALEVVAVKRMERGMGMVGEPLRTGGAGRLMRAAEVLTVAGALLGPTPTGTPEDHDADVRGGTHGPGAAT